MSSYIYQPLIFDESQIVNLYLSNKWYAYTNNLNALLKGIKDSLDVHAVYDNQKLIGLIRTVGDRNTIVYIQDILVLPEYQRQGIGTKLVQDIIAKYKHVRQIVLTTDNLEKTKQFYESIGFVDLNQMNCVGFIVKK